MILNQEIIRNELQKILSDCNEKKEGSLFEKLYLLYVGKNGLDEKEVRDGYVKIDQELKELPFAKRDLVECTVTQICAVQEHKAFLEGCHTGAQLILELMDY